MSHKHYNPLCNNHLHRKQKQHSKNITLSRCYSTPKIPKTPSSKQLFDLQSKTTRHLPQNDTLFSIKRYVVFDKTTRRFWDDEVFSTPSAVTLVTAKNKIPSTGSRIHARANTFGQYPTIPSSNQSNQSIHSLTLLNSTSKNIHRRISQIINNEIINNEKGSFDIWGDLILKRMV